MRGWYGHERLSRFELRPGTHVCYERVFASNCDQLDFRADPGIKGFQISSPEVLSSMALYASLLVFEKTSMAELCRKSNLLTGYLELLLSNSGLCAKAGSIEIITPERRGCQLSLLVRRPLFAADLWSGLRKNGILTDFRKPDILRMALTPLYISFQDIYRLFRGLEQLI